MLDQWLIHKKKFFTKIILLFLINLLVSSNVLSNDTFLGIEINGNKRISDDTIILFSEIDLTKKINENDINEALKKLYETNYFKNIIITLEKQTIYITVEEYPLIQSITFKGIKSKNLKSEISKNIKVRNRTSFNEFLLEQDREIIFNYLKEKGYYFSKINIYKNDIEDNKIDIIFDIELGEKSKIEKITFVGNKVFKDKKLKNIIVSEENRFWKFLSNKKFLNSDLISLDERLLKNFYLNKGYYDAEISSSFAKITENNNFEVIYNINAKEKFYFNDLFLKLPNDFTNSNFNKIKNSFEKLKGSHYSINKIEKILEQMEIISIQEEYQSINILVDEKITKNKINLTFEIQESEKYIVNKINIFGNNVTQENVIRNRFELDEGDPFNEILTKKTVNSIKSLGYFKSVKDEIVTNDLNKTKDINITVKEKATGEILAGAGVGSSGGTATFSIKENNYLGKGIGLQALATITEESLKGKFVVSNPHFNNSDKSVNLSVDAIETDLLSTSGYKSNKTGFSIDTNFEYLDDLRLGIGQSSYYEVISTNSTASERQKKQKGNYWDTFINVTADYDKRNQKFQTTNGFRSYYSINLPIISKTNTLMTGYSYTYYDELFEDNVSSISFYAKAANSIDGSDIKLSERLFIPSSKLRGFERGKVGPKDGNDYIGGNFVSSLNLTSTIPQILPNSQTTDFLFFLDLANIWGVDYDSSIDDTNKIRSSIGIGLDWFSVLGPINFSLSHPLSKTNTDKTESFRFNLGTTF